MARPRRARFAFQIQDGVNAGLGCGGWRVWTHDETVYLTAKSLRDTWKGSLHGDVAWRWALTAENMASEHPMLPMDHDRAQWTFTPPQFVDGARLAFVIAITRGALLPGTIDDADEVIGVEDRWDQLICARLFMTEPGIDLAEPDQLLHDPWTLTSGRRVWLTARYEALAGGKQEAPCSTAVVKPMTPERHGVAAPGILLVGARFA